MATNHGATPLRTLYIYGLIDPRTGAICYIGRTRDPARRLSQHREGRSLTLKGEWIRDLGRRHLRPDMRILETIPYDYEELAALAQARGSLDASGVSALSDALDFRVSEREEAWTAQGLTKGWPLL